METGDPRKLTQGKVDSLKIVVDALEEDHLNVEKISLPNKLWEDL